MKLLTLEWTPRMLTYGMTTETAGELCTFGPYRASITNNENPGSYLKPYVLYVRCRADNEKTTFHATIEEAKQVAAQELSENIHKMCTELGYKYETEN